MDNLRFLLLLVQALEAGSLSLVVLKLVPACDAELELRVDASLGSMEQSFTPNALYRLLLDPGKVMADQTYNSALAAPTLVLPSCLRRYLLFLPSLARKGCFDEVVRSAASIEDWHLGQFSPLATLSRHAFHHARNRRRLTACSRLH